MVTNRNVFIRILLLPLSWIYGWITSLRNLLFDREILPSESFPVSVISIGNITVGGTGKTPHTEYLVNLLKKKFHIAVLSRGYKRKTVGYLCADSSASAKTIGDEPFQIYKKNPDIIVAVDANRRNGIKQILQSNPQTDVILLDDAFQHRYVEANQSILLVDYNRPITEDYMLPYGNLRESIDGIKRADIIIVSKCPSNLTPIEARNIYKTLNLLAYQDMYYTSVKYSQPISVFIPNQTLTESSIKKQQFAILLVTGIAQPEPLVAHVKSLSKQVETILLPDHHFFTPKDMSTIIDTFENMSQAKRLIFVTEKDAARLLTEQTYPDHLKPYTFMLPISVEFLFQQQKLFNSKITDYVSKNQRNSNVPKRKNATIS
jgi:tetraacyldisaccharide 4'-kinase